MKVHVRFLVVWAAVSLAWPLSAAAFDQLYRIKDRTEVGFPEMIDEVKGADLVFVGEEHGNRLHHQAVVHITEALRAEALQGNGRTVAVGLEMFRAESQAALDKWVVGLMSESEFVSLYNDNWNFPWRKYEWLFRYARDERVRLIGLNVPEAITKKVAASGFASLTDEELRQLPPGLTCDVDEEYMEFIRKVYGRHGHGGDAFVHFCEAQMVWDKTMAHYLTEYLRENPGSQVVVLTGSVHSWKRAVPEQVRRMAEGVGFRVVLPETFNVPLKDVTPLDADYIFLTAGHG